jgi:hypothetical protein
MIEQESTIIRCKQMTIKDKTKLELDLVKYRAIVIKYDQCLRVRGTASKPSIFFLHVLGCCVVSALFLF